nr:10409_t:CDS:2 [Entrophospora candida]
MDPTDAGFCAWLRDITEQNPEDILNYGNAEELRNMFQHKPEIAA